MDQALQLGQSSGMMSYTVNATTVFNVMSERLYSAEREVYYVYEYLLRTTYK